MDSAWFYWTYIPIGSPWKLNHHFFRVGLGTHHCNIVRVDHHLLKGALKMVVDFQGSCYLVLTCVNPENWENWLNLAKTLNPPAEFHPSFNLLIVTAFCFGGAMVNLSSPDLPLVGKKQSHHITLGAMFRSQDTSITDFLEGWKKASRSAFLWKKTCLKRHLS